MNTQATIVPAGLRRLLGLTALLAFALTMIGPFLMVLISSFGKGWFGARWLPEVWTLEFYAWAFAVNDVGKILINSLAIAAICTALSLLAGVPAGWAIARGGLPARELLVALVLLPRLIPPITYGLGVAQIFYGLGLVNTHAGVALAHSILTIPYTVLIMSSAFEGLDVRLQEAAEVCGASRWMIVRSVVLPQVMPAMLSASLFAFVTSYNEFTLSILTTGPATQTLPIKAFLVIGDGYWELASALSIILLVPSLLILLTIQGQVKPEKLFGGLKGA